MKSRNKLLLALATLSPLLSAYPRVAAADDPPYAPWCDDLGTAPTQSCYCLSLTADGSQPVAGSSCPQLETDGMVLDACYPADRADMPSDSYRCLLEPGQSSGPPPTHEEYSYPKYWLVTIIYAPPGIGSTVQYQNGTSTGSRVEIKNTVTKGTVFHAESNAGEAEGEFKWGTAVGNSFEIKTTDSFHDGLTSKSDGFSYQRDKFYLWLNPKFVSIVDPFENEISTSLVSDGDPIIEDFTYAELAGIVDIPEYRKAILANLTDQDKANILAVDPWYGANNHPQWDSNRFGKAPYHIQFRGPDHPGDDIPQKGVDFQKEDQHGTLSGTVASAEFKFTAGEEVSWGVVEKAMAGISLSWEYERTKEDFTGGIAQATTTLQSETPCYHQGVDIYFDHMFGTYAFAPTDPGSSDCGNDGNVNGTVVVPGASGAGKDVRLTLKDGTSWLGKTNAKGLYRFYGVKVPVAKIEVVGYPNASIQQMHMGP
jgi:hypothetical protein